ncbi:YwqI/YxiC family protein [Peribacillus sp. Hz7]|uniref:YwqI/YxiC family protein n=1 Tax=Peribacillus sp. Hz7 TaxID=3344873 RepID=UPI0035CA3C1B
MQNIKLDYSEVIQQLNDVKKKLSELHLPSPSETELGQNQLTFTKEWLQREENLQKMVIQYMQAVQKNVEDTHANVDILKKQDEAIVK